MQQLLRSSTDFATLAITITSVIISVQESHALLHKVARFLCFVMTLHAIVSLAAATIVMTGNTHWSVCHLFDHATVWVQKVVFTDVRDEAVASLHAELARQISQFVCQWSPGRVPKCTAASGQYTSGASRPQAFLQFPCVL